MSRNHPYVDLYNQRHIILCCGQGAWEDEMVKSTGLMKETFDRLGVNAWCDFWGSDVNHDWPWWRKQLPIFRTYFIRGENRNMNLVFISHIMMIRTYRKAGTLLWVLKRISYGVRQRRHTKSKVHIMRRQRPVHMGCIFTSTRKNIR